MKNRKSLFESLEGRIQKSASDLTPEFLSALELTSSVNSFVRGSDAEEVAHIAALKLLVKEDFSSLPEESQRAFAATVVKRTAIDLLRKEKTQEGVR